MADNFINNKQKVFTILGFFSDSSWKSLTNNSFTQFSHHKNRKKKEIKTKMLLRD